MAARTGKNPLQMVHWYNIAERVSGESPTECAVVHSQLVQVVCFSLSNWWQREQFVVERTFQWEYESFKKWQRDQWDVRRTEWRINCCWRVTESSPSMTEWRPAVVTGVKRTPTLKWMEFHILCPGPGREERTSSWRPGRSSKRLPSSNTASREGGSWSSTMWVHEEMWFRAWLFLVFCALYVYSRFALLVWLL